MTYYVVGRPATNTDDDPKGAVVVTRAGEVPILRGLVDPLTKPRAFKSEWAARVIRDRCFTGFNWVWEVVTENELRALLGKKPRRSRAPVTRAEYIHRTQEDDHEPR
jgi:hypothetical protein